MPRSHVAIPILVLLLCSILLPGPGKSYSQTACPKRPEPANSSVAALLAGPGGDLLYRENVSRKLIPASTLKLLTALTAIHHLGETHRFKTDFYQDRQGNLSVKGYGDPLLLSEVWQEIADEVSGKVSRIHDLILDDSFYSPGIRVPGCKHSSNPYDAPLGALCSNFNTISLKTEANGRVLPGEPQTPLTPLALKKIRTLNPGDGRFTFTHRGEEACRYSGELFAHFLGEKGVQIEGEIRRGIVASGDRRIYTYPSRFSLLQVLEKMLEFSNNFIANQLVIALGARKYGPPGTLENGVRILRSYARENLSLKGLRILEGSGISKDNRLSALDMLSVLEGFQPYRNLLPRKDNILYKTGSLSGVRTCAGYIDDPKGRTFRFVILINRERFGIGPLMSFLSRVVERY